MTNNIPDSFDVSAFIAKARNVIRTKTEADTQPSPGALSGPVDLPKPQKLAFAPAVEKLRPLYKWQGGKTRLLTTYTPHLPVCVDSYVEPFFGAGALFCHVRNVYSRMPALINDINPYLVNVLNTIKHYPALFTKHVKQTERDYLAISSYEERRQFFYQARENYWSLEDKRKLIPEAVSVGVCAAAALYFMLKTSFNGLWQPMKTRNDYFGTAFGRGNEKPGFIDYNLIFEWHEHLQDTTISNCRYEENHISDNSFVFCEPPYLDNKVTYGE